MATLLLLGKAEVDITPPLGTMLAGSLDPRDRVSQDVRDPLFVKAVVLESGGKRLAIVTFDLIAIPQSLLAEAIAGFSARSGIPEEHIFWSASHTHNGPTLDGIYPKEYGEVVNRKWLATVPQALTRCLEEADSRKEAVRFSRARGHCLGLSHNRRLRFKDGRILNTWLLGRGEEEVQSLGTAGPMDPEVVALAFDDMEGRLVTVIYNFALHANSRWGDRLFSADYPGVVAGLLRHRFGPQLTTLYLPGACGDVSPINKADHNGQELAAVLIWALSKRKPVETSLEIGGRKNVVAAALRDPWREGEEERLAATQWGAKEQEYFHSSLRELRAENRRERETVVQSCRLGPVGFACIPGELFVEWGLKIKEASPFPWTLPVTLSGDAMGYLVTEEAWRAGGYESLVTKSSPVSVEGVKSMVSKALEQLGELYGKGHG